MAGSAANRAHSGLEKNENGSRCGEKGRILGSSDIQETSPDLLKNTPSNIAKLEDVIEHCKGRQKYLTQTRSPSDGGDVRWYFCNVPLAEKELAASIPQTVIVDKGDYFRFGMRDSLAIEAFFLQSWSLFCSSTRAFDTLRNSISNVKNGEWGVPCTLTGSIIINKKPIHAQPYPPKSGNDCNLARNPQQDLGQNKRSSIISWPSYVKLLKNKALSLLKSLGRNREEELLSSWWKEYAECSEGPKDRSGSSKTSNKEFKESSEVPKLETIYEIEEERVGVPVKGGLYEVDLVKRHLFPVYWNGENRRVLRGHWFALKGGLDWRPLREDVAEQLEIAYRSQVWHRRKFQPSGLFAARVDLQSSTLGLHALFTGEDDTWEAWLNVDASGFSSFLGLGGKGIRLRRGYSASDSPKVTQDELRQQKEEEMDDYCSKVPVRHLVFMVHGIGQRLQNSNLVDDVGNHRHITSSLAERHLTSHQLGMQRVLFIPCQWRKCLKLSSESAVDKCTLDGVRGLRVMLGATVHDVLYYMSPIYCQDIINSVSNQLNRLYLKFMRRNPGYDGKVSVYGHSLGSVLSYDILCHQENLSSPFPMDWMYKEKLKAKGLSTDTENQSSTSESLSNAVNPDAKDTSSSCRIEEIICTIDNEAIGGYKTNSTNKGESLEDSSAVMDSVTSDFDENTSGAINGKESFGRMAEQEHSNGNVKDELIKCLREEVDQLKEKVAAFEKQTTDRSTRKEVGKDVTPGCEEPTSGNPAPVQDDQPKSYTPYINYTKLEFKVDTFFAVGSPLGVFLALRNIRIGIGKGKEYWDEENISEEIPACRQMFNIFHPFDPVAYRVEPLVCKEYFNIRPVIIPYHKGGKRLHIGFQEFTEDLAVRSHAMMNHLRAVRVKVLTICQSKKADMDGDEEENSDDEEEVSYGALMMKRLSGSEGGRIDHMLQDKTFEHPYLQAIGSHTNYWRDYDTALFILKHLYRDIPEEPSGIAYESKGGSDLTGWRDRREVAEEELPLTFSDRNAARNFSRKAKKIIKN